MKDFNLKIAKQQLLSEIKVNKPGGPRIYVNEDINDLFKIENFPIISDIRSILYSDKPFSLQQKENPQFWEIIDKIRNYLKETGISPDISFSGTDFSSSGTSYIFGEDEGVFTIFQNWEYLGKDEDWDSNQNWEKI